jgi:hypothetical protein
MVSLGLLHVPSMAENDGVTFRRPQYPDVPFHLIPALVDPDVQFGSYVQVPMSKC